MSSALVVKGLTRSYGSRVVVDQLDLRVEPGDIYGFLGPNGAGKTTAMRCVLGLIRRDAGEVTLFGETGPRARRHVGAMIETPAFHLWMTGRQNLEHAAAYEGLRPKEAAPLIDRLLARVGLKERGKEKVSGYSLGMKQRLGIARALLGSPRLLVLDEPTNGLDPDGMVQMRDLIRSLARNDGLTVFLSSHLLSEVQALCTRVGIIKEGRMQVEGLVSELLSGVSAKVGPEQLLLVTASPEALEKALLEGGQITAVHAQRPGELLVDLAEGAHLASVMAALGEAGALVQSVTPVKRDFEDVYMEAVRS